LAEHGQLTLKYQNQRCDLFRRVEPKDNWNLLIGGNWEINKRWSLTAEVGGVLDRFHAIGAVMWRF
jgi:hypothetical protein